MPAPGYAAGLAERTGAAVLAVARENQEKREQLGPFQYDSIYVETGLVKDPENNLQYSVNDLNQQLLVRPSLLEMFRTVKVMLPL